MDILDDLALVRRQRRRCVMITVVKTRGSTPRKAGTRMLFFDDGTSRGSIGGGVVEHQVVEEAQRVLGTGQPVLVERELTAQLAMCCGGAMTFFIEPLRARPSLIVMGCGHVGRALIQSAAPLDFHVIAVDDLEENLAAESTRQAHRLVPSYEPSDLTDLPFGDDAYVVIATRQHALDQRLLELCLDHRTHFLGVIGSQRKAHLQRERLAAKGYSSEAIARVNCPVGVELGAQTPAEIAVSICASLIAARHGEEAKTT